MLRLEHWRPGVGHALIRDHWLDLSTMAAVHIRAGRQFALEVFVALEPTNNSQGLTVGLVAFWAGMASQRCVITSDDSSR